MTADKLMDGLLLMFMQLTVGGAKPGTLHTEQVPAK